MIWKGILGNMIKFVVAYKLPYYNEFSFFLNFHAQLYKEIMVCHEYEIGFDSLQLNQ